LLAYKHRSRPRAVRRWDEERIDDKRACLEEILEHEGGDYSEPRWEQKQTNSEYGNDRRNLDDDNKIDKVQTR
jgi:hypothetical protein